MNELADHRTWKAGDDAPAPLPATAHAAASAAAAPAVRSRIAFFGHDANESTIRKRIGAFLRHGAHVHAFTFRRDHANATAPERWPNVALGTTSDRNYLSRIAKLVRAVPRLARHRRALARCDVFYARNLDMLALAALAQRLSGKRSRLVYEVLDVQRVMTRSDIVGRAFRLAERILLRRCTLLVVSSPDFVAHYFEPSQGYRGPWYLLENKVVPADDGMQSPAPGARSPPPGPPWVIGWFGTLRCVRSLKILCALADRFPDRVHVVLRGRPSERDLPTDTIRAAVAGRSNMAYHGPYRSPDDLPDIYGAVHLSWSIDYLDAGTNSDWLLPNRVYEGGLHGALQVARQGTATGRMVDRLGIGWTLPEPLEECAEAFIRRLSSADIASARERLAGCDAAVFADETDTRQLLERMMRSRSQPKASKP
ncbi:MAG: glucosyl transferase [Hyphomicrobiaceae bacterium]|nr:glucosyl transferase [Hyphomicrobiaceae bacterium]